MTVLTRAGVQPADLPTETVPAPALGGDVIVRALTLTDRMAVAQLLAPIYAQLGDESDTDVRARVGAAAAAQYLSRTVVLEDGQPLYTAAEWEHVGGKHTDTVMALYRVVKRMNGLDAEAVQKN